VGYGFRVSLSKAMEITMILPLISFTVATFFATAALYITLVEHPARLATNDAAMLAQWQPSYKRALPIQAGLAILGGLLGSAVWYQTRDWRWLAGSFALLANWPFTLVGIMPTNKKLMATPVSVAGPDSRALLHRWGALHNVRSLLGGISAAFFGLGVLGLS
jgi:hypothetical protein